MANGHNGTKVTFSYQNGTVGQKTGNNLERAPCLAIRSRIAGLRAGRPKRRLFSGGEGLGTGLIFNYPLTKLPTYQILSGGIAAQK
jgi:hypothetical protein